MVKRIQISDLALGKCPHCSEFATFIPTRKKDIFICDACEDKVRQYKNGKIHWYKYNDAQVFKV
jgi:hypothetical protein